MGLRFLRLEHVKPEPVSIGKTYTIFSVRTSIRIGGIAHRITAEQKILGIFLPPISFLQGEYTMYCLNIRRTLPIRSGITLLKDVIRLQVMVPVKV